MPRRVATDTWQFRENLLGPLVAYQSRISLFALLLASIAFAIASLAPTVFSPDAMSISATISAAAGVSFFGLCAWFVLSRLARKKPAVVVDSDGLTDRASAVALGFIPWSDIVDAKVVLQNSRSSRHKFLGVSLRDPDKYLARCGPLARGLLRLNNRMTGYIVNIPQATLSVKVEEILTRMNFFIHRHAADGSRPDLPASSGPTPGLRQTQRRGESPDRSNSFINRTKKLNATSEALIAQSKEWLGRALAARGDDIRPLLEEAQGLPARIDSHLMDLGSSKALEWSSDGPVLSALAAKVALVLHGAGWSQLESYERYARHDRSTSKQADPCTWSYTDFKDWFVEHDRIDPAWRDEAEKNWQATRSV